MENGITIGLGNNIDGKCMDWHNFDVITVDDIKRKIIVYAFGKPSIWTEIFAFQGKRNEFVIKNVKYNKRNNTYSIYFNDNINNIDKNWYEKINDTFVERPLISQYENIKIHIKNKKNKQTNFKQQSIQDFKSLEKIREEMTDEKIDQKFMVLIARLDDLIQKPFGINTLIKTDEINNGFDQMVDIRLEINKMDKLIVKKKDIEDRIKLGEEIELQQGNEVKMKDLMVEKEREECEIIVEQILDECSYLQEMFENRRKEVEENINKFDKIKVMMEKIESSMNSEVAQGYGKNKEKEKEIEREFQEVVSKGIELLNINININLQNRWANNGIENGKNGNVNVGKNLNCMKYNTESKIVVNDLEYCIFECTECADTQLSSGDVFMGDLDKYSLKLKDISLQLSPFNSRDTSLSPASSAYSFKQISNSIVEIAQGPNSHPKKYTNDDFDVDINNEEGEEEFQFQEVELLDGICDIDISGKIDVNINLQISKFKFFIIDDGG